MRFNGERGIPVRSLVTSAKRELSTENGKSPFDKKSSAGQMFKF